MSNPKRQVRIDLAPDVVERYDPTCQKLDVTLTWLVNHLLRTIARADIGTTVDARPEGRVPVRRVSHWQVKL